MSRFLAISHSSPSISASASESASAMASCSSSGGHGTSIRDADAQIDAMQDVTGTGAMTKRGEGALVLSAATTYTGETTVEGGALIVNGSNANSVLTTVMDGARLGGNGTTGSVAVQSGGTFGAGNSIGALDVDGDLTFADGATFEVETDDTGRADTVAVTGAVDIQGGTALVIGEGLNYAPELSTEILSAQTGITGRFSDIVSTLAFLDADLAYGTNALTLDLERNDTAFDMVAGTANGRSAAAGVESLGFGNDLYDAVVMLGAESASASFDSLSGSCSQRRRAPSRNRAPQSGISRVSNWRCRLILCRARQPSGFRAMASRPRQRVKLQFGPWIGARSGHFWASMPNLRLG